VCCVCGESFTNFPSEVKMTQIIDMGGSAATATPRRRASRRKTYRRRSYRRVPYTRRRYRRRVSRVPTAVMSKYALAHIDPFSQKVIGCKIPDSNTYPSNAFRVDDAWSVKASDGSYGTTAFALLPSLKNQFIVCSTPSENGKWGWNVSYGGGTDSSRITGIANNYSLYRPVAMGVKLSCPGAATTISGNLHVAVIANSDFGKTTWWFPTNVSQMSNCMFYRRYPLSMFTQQTLTMVNKFLDQTACRYMDPNSDGIDNSGDISFQHNGWATIIVAVEGSTNSTNVIQAEVVLHVEAIPDKSGVSTATPAAAFNINELQQVSEIAGRTEAAFADQDRTSYMSEAVRAATRGMRNAADRVFWNWGVPAAEAAGAAAVSYAANRYGIPGITNRPFLTSGLSD